MTYQKAEVEGLIGSGVPGGNVREVSLQPVSSSNNGLPTGKFAVAAVFLLSTMAYMGASPSASPANVPVASVAIEGASVDTPTKGKLFDSLDRYVLEDYDNKKAFSDFLPGVAGIFGKPMWSFFVNRGQGIASFGVESKNYPLMKFDSANLAYQNTPFLGFRTFIQGSRGGEEFLTEPFSPSNAKDGYDDDDKPNRYMYVGLADMEIQEIDDVNEIETKATYFILPEENFGAFVRKASFTNIGDTPVTLSLLDGLAKMEPKGGPLDWMLNNLGRTLEGWFEVDHFESNPAYPIYKMSSEPSDSASVTIEEGGNFVLSVLEGDDSTSFLPIVFDPTKVFGQGSSLVSPRELTVKSVGDILNGPQYGFATTSCALTALNEVTLAAGESIGFTTYFGAVDKVDQVADIVDSIKGAGYAQAKLDRTREIMDELSAGVTTETGSHLFNGHVKQMYIDNGLRGGVPIMLGDVDETTLGKSTDEDPRVKVFHTFSRIHGDLERDYNWFNIDMTYFSQGPGNYRDIAQNRRNDVIFQPRLGSFDILEFLSFIQADAYEPLTVEAIAFKIDDKAKAMAICDEAVGTGLEVLGHYNQLVDILTNGFVRPGQLFQLIDQLGIELIVDKWKFINTVIAAAEYIPIAQFGEGYWADHWDYYIDLIKAFLMVFPDGEEKLMYEHELKYFFSPASVNPRSKKYVLDYTFDYKGKHVEQLGATYWDQSKLDAQKGYLDKATGRIGEAANWQSQEDGAAFTSTPIVKLFLLGSIKFATRDAYGMGVEYEGGKPGWNDAMNGLVGMIGSGMPETYELHQLLSYVLSVVEKFDRGLVIPAELGVMTGKVNDALDTLDATGYEASEDLDSLSRAVPADLFTYWDTVATARETYRTQTKYSFSGVTVEISGEDAAAMIKRWIAQINLGIERAFKIGSQGDGDSGHTGISPCYFSYDVTKWEENGGTDADGRPTVNALAMTVGSFPLFLEGPTRYMKTIEGDLEKMDDTYSKVLGSGLRDTELNMYFISASLKGQNPSMGRMMGFSPGWLENQSIWVHMSYKYYLQLIRGGMYEKLFDEMKAGGMLPFMDPDVYGRSLMECSSFIASSAFPDPSRHGEGFLARLSGSTAEFLSIYALMMYGPEPFFIDEDKTLKMQLVPAIPLWLFKDDFTVSFLLFSAIKVTYNNSLKTDLFRENPSSYKIYYKDGITKEVEGSIIPTDIAIDVRRVYTVDSIDVFF